MQCKRFGVVKSIAGTAFLGLGVLILYQNLSGAVARLRDVLGSNGSAALGLLPAVIQAVAQVVQAYAANRQQLLHSLLQHMLVLSWPLLLVKVGTVLSRDTSTENVSPKNICASVDPTRRRSTSK